MEKFTYNNIPEELRSLKQWGLFELKWIPERNKNTKIPINPYDGSAGKSNDPSTWSDFDTAVRALEEVERASGLAFYFANGYVGLDIDHIDSNLEDWRQGDNDPNNLVNKFQTLTNKTYMESMQSLKVKSLAREDARETMRCIKRDDFSLLLAIQSSLILKFNLYQKIK